jgi:hypothetical protein
MRLRYTNGVSITIHSCAHCVPPSYDDQGPQAVGVPSDQLVGGDLDAWHDCGLVQKSCSELTELQG